MTATLRQEEAMEADEELTTETETETGSWVGLELQSERTFELPGQIPESRTNILLLGMALVVAGLLAAVAPHARQYMHDWRKVAPSTQTEILQGHAVASGGNCSSGIEDCSHTKCCSGPGLQCYAKNSWYAQCRVSCVPGGRDPLATVDALPWSCTALGNRTSGKAIECSLIGEDCTHSKCCADTGLACYEKNITWATCRASCHPGLDPEDVDAGSWSCNQLGAHSKRAEWIEWHCSDHFQDCTSSRCCKQSQTQCYKKNDYWAVCKDTCTPGPSLSDSAQFRSNWSCKALGFRTPNTAEEALAKLALAAPLKAPSCAASGADCSHSRCCASAGELCYEKNASWAACRARCSRAGVRVLGAGSSDEDCDDLWNCDELPRYASLFCFSVMLVDTFEQRLMTAQVAKGAGIFACDDHFVLADGVVSLGRPPSRRSCPWGVCRESSEEVITRYFPKQKVWTTTDGTAANTLVFLKAWDIVISDGRFRRHAWTIKVDPDAVLLPSRLRQHLFKHTGSSVYVLDCNKFEPMMYGAVEAFSVRAIKLYAERGWHCASELKWTPWGEDKYMTRCLNYLGVQPVTNFYVVGDDRCSGAICGDGLSAAYHPFKEVAQWMTCFDEAAATLRTREGPSRSALPPTTTTSTTATILLAPPRPFAVPDPERWQFPRPLQAGAQLAAVIAEASATTTTIATTSSSSVTWTRTTTVSTTRTTTRTASTTMPPTTSTELPQETTTSTTKNSIRAAGMPTTTYSYCCIYSTPISGGDVCNACEKLQAGSWCSTSSDHCSNCGKIYALEAKWCQVDSLARYAVNFE